MQLIIQYKALVMALFMLYEAFSAPYCLAKNTRLQTKNSQPPYSVDTFNPVSHYNTTDPSSQVYVGGQYIQDKTLVSVNQIGLSVTFAKLTSPTDINDLVNFGTPQTSLIANVGTVWGLYDIDNSHNLASRRPGVGILIGRDTNEIGFRINSKGIPLVDANNATDTLYHLTGRIPLTINENFSTIVSPWVNSALPSPNEGLRIRYSQKIPLLNKSSNNSINIKSGLCLSVREDLGQANAAIMKRFWLCNSAYDIRGKSGAFGDNQEGYVMMDQVTQMLNVILPVKGGSYNTQCTSAKANSYSSYDDSIFPDYHSYCTWISSPNFHDIIGKLNKKVSVWNKNPVHKNKKLASFDANISKYKVGAWNLGAEISIPSVIKAKTTTDYIDMGIVFKDIVLDTPNPQHRTGGDATWLVLNQPLNPHDTKR